MLGVSPEKFAEIAAAVFRPKPPPTVSLDHVHMRAVSVKETANLLRLRLAELGQATFAELVADCEHTIDVVSPVPRPARALREATVLFEQDQPLGSLLVKWTGGTLEEATAAAAAAAFRAAATMRSTGDHAGRQPARFDAGAGGPKRIRLRRRKPKRIGCGDGQPNRRAAR